MTPQDYLNLDVLLSPPTAKKTDKAQTGTSGLPYEGAVPFFQDYSPVSSLGIDSIYSFMSTENNGKQDGKNPYSLENLFAGLDAGTTYDPVGEFSLGNILKLAMEPPKTEETAKKEDPKAKKEDKDAEIVKAAAHGENFNLDTLISSLFDIQDASLKQTQNGKKEGKTAKGDEAIELAASGGDVNLETLLVSLFQAEKEDFANNGQGLPVNTIQEAQTWSNAGGFNTSDLLKGII